ncbi:multicomponent Na+:H+ antiporter subunit D [Maritalea mobilis]|uniref:Multicomponent Na+:H+ antiporter subunit D n=1 Tax=Maritalea mobilis TaxID=483324 RepID=A0A4R6VNQ0_9HYPH|nr:Na+/H+ antiporter subunit D [Maritalea mobilis]TDQ63852.1 multicomponent Na+:H+ antiporter subunit D [Maritalea mobilis]
MAGSASTPKNLDLPPAMIEGVTSVADWVIVWPIALPMLGAAVLLMARKRPEWQAPFAFVILLATLVANFMLYMRVQAEGPLTMTMGNWLPPYGISLTADALSALFSLVSAFILLIVVLFVQSEVETRENKYGYHSLLLLLLTGVSGGFLTGDLFNLYVWFEVMLIASFGLLIIGGRKIQLDGAVKYGFLNFLATTFFLIAIGFLYGLVGTLNMADIALKAPQVESGAIYAVAALFFLAFAMKGAAFPLNAWLPASYHAPDPAVSAVFAGLLTKVGVYALVRTHLLLIPQSHAQLQLVMEVVAAFTLILAPLGAMAQTNARRALGFLVVGGIGAMLAGLAIGSPTGVFGLAAYAVNSMLVMTALYLVVGLVERMGGTSDIRKLGGLYRANSWLSILFIVLVFAVAGLPPFLGFWPKMILVQAGVEVGNFWLVAFILLNSILTSIAGTRLWAHIFWRDGREGANSEQINERIRPLTTRAKVWGLLPAGALVAFIVVAGLVPQPLFKAGATAAFAIYEPAEYVGSVFGSLSAAEE